MFVFSKFPFLNFLRKWSLLNMEVIWGEGELPAIPHQKLLDHFSNTRVSTVFITEDDLECYQVIQEKVAIFMEDYGMKKEKIAIYVAIARNPTCKWGQGFPFKMRISIFPKREHDLLVDQ